MADFLLGFGTVEVRTQSCITTANGEVSAVGIPLKDRMSVVSFNEVIRFRRRFGKVSETKSMEIEPTYHNAVVVFVQVSNVRSKWVSNRRTNEYQNLEEC